ncbi:MAG: YopT-type cysteine protease domain-containing protein [Planctomycetia bacterium]
MAFKIQIFQGSFLYFTVETKLHGGGHAIGLCVSRDNSSNYSYHFFDPNMGEYLFRNQNDFINFMGAWTRSFNRWFHSIKCNERNPPREPLVRWDLSLLIIPRNYNFEDNPFKYMNFFRK